jgi:hypothetical protein
MRTKNPTSTATSNSLTLSNFNSHFTQEHKYFSDLTSLCRKTYLLLTEHKHLSVVL